MIVDINKIVVRDRIRKDFGDIKELADDIKRNGLINPPAISRNYELIAGERRLRACKSLGWKQIEVHQIDVDDAEKQLYMEISENETRKDFSMTERLDYARRLARVESAKAKERMSEGGKEGVQNFAQVPSASTPAFLPPGVVEMVACAWIKRAEPKTKQPPETIDGSQYSEYSDGGNNGSAT